MTHTIHLDRSLRLDVNDGAGRPITALRLTRSAAEVLADALLEFSGNRVSGLSRRSAVKVDAGAAAPARKVRAEAEAQ